jgi:hypothetical protein
MGNRDGWRDNIKTDLKETDNDDVGLVQQVQDSSNGLLL